MNNLNSIALRDCTVYSSHNAFITLYIMKIVQSRNAKEFKVITSTIRVSIGEVSKKIATIILCLVYLSNIRWMVKEAIGQLSAVNL